jgi:hypothetical protein
MEKEINRLKYLMGFDSKKKQKSSYIHETINSKYGK